jgi:23S rRNA pseudouridine955/2504/2580 synthase
MHKAIQQGVNASVSHIEVDSDDEGQRLDNFLTRRFPNVPKSRLYKAIRSGEVRVNKGRTNAKYKIAAGDVLRIPPLVAVVQGAKVADDISRVAHYWLNAVRDSILYEDDDFFILNKPSGLAVHGGSGLKYGLIEVLRQLRPEAKRLELVHRLDRDTSGCIMIAKKGSALRQLHAALRERRVTKRYQALVFGKWPRSVRFVEAPLHKVALSSGERVVRVSEQGQASRTEFSVLNRYPGATLVEVIPVTGRTHQIRVHAAHQGHCLLGDDKYAHPDAAGLAGALGLSRLFLHAASLSLMAPSGKRLEIHAPMGQTLLEVLARCVDRI